MRHHQPYINGNKQNYSDKIDLIEKFLPLYTEHLHELHLFAMQIKNVANHFERNEIKHDFSDLREQIDFNSLLTISMLDLIVVCKGVLHTRHIWEEIYFLRKACLLIYETLSLYNRRNKTFNQIITRGSQEVVDLAKSITNNIRKFKREYGFDTTITDIRNAAAGHIDENFLAYFDRLSKIDRDLIKEACFEFIAILSQMQGLSAKIADFLGSELDVRTQTIDARINDYIVKINGLFKAAENGIRQ